MKHLVMGTAGHVDHGKTALIKALTNIDCDTHKEEKRRGITINLGFTYLDLPSGMSVGIIDVPGHKDFINTMVAGANGIDFVLMVIAADSGIMPQTHEHFNILEVLGVNRGIFVLTKADLVDNELADLARLEIADFLTGTAFEGAPVVKASAVTGEGLDDLKKIIDDIASKIEERPKGDFFRMYIDRIFSKKGFGHVVTGSVLSGELDISKEVFLLPESNKKFRIRRIEKHGREVDRVHAGDRAAINLTGIKKEDFQRGMLLSDKYVEGTNMIDARLTLFNTGTRLGLWSNCIFHSATFECQAKIHLLDRNELLPAQNAMAQLHLNKACVLMPGDRFIIRNSSNDLTLGGGEVYDTNPLHHRRRSNKLVESMSKLSQGDIVELMKIELKKSLIPVRVEDIARKINKPPDELITVLGKEDVKDIELYGTGRSMLLIDKHTEENFTSTITDSITAFHKKNPLFPHGLNIEEIKGKLGMGKVEEGNRYTESLLNKMEKEGIIGKYKNTWISKDHKVIIDSKTEDDLDWLEQEIKEYGMQKPVMADIEEDAKERKITRDKFKLYLKYLVQQNKVHYYEGDYIHKTIVDKCRNIMLEELKNNKEGVNDGEFKALINGTRKICPVLTGIFETEKIIARKGVNMIITEKGRNFKV